MKRKEIYDEIVTAFDNKFSELGKQFAHEFCLSASSYNIETFSNPDFRVRRHLLLYWGAGWLKSSLLSKAYDILTPDLSTIISDVTLAALRGSVDFGKFVVPYTLKRPFSICTEFGQVVQGGDSSEMFQKLLNVLEEGKVTVSLGKISSLSPAQRAAAEEETGVTFIDNNTFTYTTKWILMAGTYNKKFLVDDAFQSRFRILTPNIELNGQLAKHIINSKWELDEDVSHMFKAKILENRPIDTIVKLPDEVYDKKLTMRNFSSIMQEVLCRRWWGLKMDKDDILDLADSISYNQELIWKSTEDKIFDAIENEPLSIDEICKKTKLSKKEVFKSIKHKLRIPATIIDGERKYGII